MPPSTKIVRPVTYEAMSETSTTTIPAMSSGSPDPFQRDFFHQSPTAVPIVPDRTG